MGPAPQERAAGAHGSTEIVLQLEGGFKIHVHSQ